MRISLVAVTAAAVSAARFSALVLSRFQNLQDGGVHRVPVTHFFVALHRRMFRQARNCVDTGEQKRGISKPLTKSKAHVREQGGIFAHELCQLRMRRFEFFDGFLQFVQNILKRSGALFFASGFMC